MTEKYRAAPDSMLPESPEQKLAERETVLKNRMLNFLEKQNAITYGEDNETICNLNNLTALDSKKFDNIKRVVDELGDGSYLISLIKTFENKSIYSKEDYEQRKINPEAKMEAKPLFYSPEPGRELDFDAIKEASFYLMPSDFNSVNWRKLNEFYLQEFGITAQEAELAMKVYNQNFGDGFRDEAGNLMVKEKFDDDRENPAYTPIGSDWLRYVAKIKWTGETKTRSGGKSDEWSQPKMAIGLEKYQRLRESGLLTTEDFKQVGGSPTAELFRAEKNIRAKGMVYLEGAQYTMGSEFEGKKIVKLSETLYGIVDNVKGYEKVTHTFTPLSAEGIEQKKRDFKERTGRESLPGNITVRKGEVEINEFKETELNPKREDETVEEYAQRVPVIAAKNFNMLKDLSHDLSLEAKIGIHNLSLREQEWLASYAFSLENRYDEVVQFAKKFGLEGLKTFLACEYGDDSGDRVLSIAKHVEKNDATKIFQSYNQIIQRAEKISSALANSEIIKQNETIRPMQNLLSQQILESISRRAKDILYVGAGIGESGRASADFFGKKIETKNINEVMGSLDLYADILEKLNLFLTPDKENGVHLVKTESGVPESYLFEIEGQSRSFIMLQLREKGVSLGEHNAMTEYDGEARINFLFSDEPIMSDIKSPSRKNAFSLRLDREGKKREQNKIIHNDPTRQAGELSLDIGSIENPTGRIIAIGNSLSHEILKQRADQYPQYYHNRESFNSYFGDADNFAELVQAIKQQIIKHYGSDLNQERMAA